MNKHVSLFLVPFCCAFVPVLARGGVEELQGEYRDGQVFLQWRESGLPDGATLNVYVHDRPIAEADLSDARRVGFFIEQHSARDWTKDPSFFESDGQPVDPVGFRIRAHGPRLDPADGLFVHTVTPQDSTAGYYAVTIVEHPAGGEQREMTALAAGQNTLAAPIAQQVAPIQPVWDAEGEPPHAAPGLPLVVVLHSRRGGRTMNYYDYILFGDASQGWREGLPHMFKVVAEESMVRIYPSDRVWKGHGRAFHSFWYGYHSRIYSPSAMQEGGEVVNYGERRLLWLMDWAQRELSIDPDRVYLTGSSMGGCGSVSMALHHPERLAAIQARVPVVSYTPPVPGYERGTDWRITTLCGPLAGNAPTTEGMTVLERMNGVAWVEKAGTLPFMYLVNGRQDNSIPWYNNPPFYAAMNAARQGFAAYWDNGEHGTAGNGAPEDVLAWRDAVAVLLRFSLKQSFPAFSNFSDNRRPGNGQKEDGDVVGWINRGLDWSDIADEPDRYAISVAARYPGLTYPVSVDLTPRRLQKFRPEPGAACAVTVGSAPAVTVTADAKGLVTVRGVRIPSVEAVRVEIRPAPPHPSGPRG